MVSDNLIPHLNFELSNMALWQWIGRGGEGTVNSLQGEEAGAALLHWLHHTNNIPAMSSTTSSRAEMVTQGKLQISPVGNVEVKNSGRLGCCGWLLVCLSMLFVIATFPITIFMCIKLLTKDSVTVSVDGVVYFSIYCPISSVSNVSNANTSTRLLAQTTLRNVLGTKNLSELLSDREGISHSMQEALDGATHTWGIKVERVEIKDVKLPQQLQRAMAAEAEASREARAKIIAAEGEMNASRALKEASLVIAESPSALQLRYLQTLNSIAAEKNSTIIFPLPIDILQHFMQRKL
ncbi:hypothetical protein Q8A73_007035 [Channa argus]|nr:hypothetical protein Q8A73_007035 [Channa argus]